MSLFGNAPAASSGGGLFGNSGTTGGSLFGNNAASNTGGGLFGNSATTTNATTGGLFGNKPAATTTGGLFGNSAATTTGTTGGGLFGNNAATTGTTGLFGNSGTTTTTGLFGNSGAATTGGGLFGNKPAATTGGGLFGNSTTTGGGLFGNNNTTTTTTGGLFGNNTAPTGGLFGTKPAAQQPGHATASLFASINGQNSAQQVKRPTVQQCIHTYPELEGSFKQITCGLAQVENQTMASIRNGSSEVNQLLGGLKNTLNKLMKSTADLNRSTRQAKTDFEEEVVPTVKKTIHTGTVLSNTVTRSGLVPSATPGSGYAAIKVPTPIYGELLEDLDRRFRACDQDVSGLQASADYAAQEVEAGGADNKMVVSVIEAQNRRYETLSMLARHALLEKRKY